MTSSPLCGRGGGTAVSGNSGSIARSMMYVVCCCFFTGRVVMAQQGPDPNLAAELFNTSTTHRQDLCTLYHEVENNTVSLPDALNGVAIRPFLWFGDPYVIMKEETTTGPEGGTTSSYVLDPNYPGLVPLLLDEICDRAGCTWRDSYALSEPNVSLPKGKSWTQYLQWQIRTYDLAATWWMISNERLRLGISFPEGWDDASVILVGKTATSTAESSPHGVFMMWAWLSPFSGAVWGMIVVTIFVSGATYWFIQLLDPAADERESEASITWPTYHSAMSFVGGQEFEPKSHGARVFVFSMGFWALLITSAYTANLASFLVVRNTPPTQVNGVDDAVRLGKRLCTSRGASDEAQVLKRYPQANVVQFEGYGIFQGLLDGKCDYAVATVLYWNLVKVGKINSGCDLELVGDVFQPFDVGFATSADSGARCTSLVRDVFHLHLREMKGEGVIDELMEEYSSKTAVNDCSVTTAGADGSDPSNLSDDEGEEPQLKLGDMGGIFVMHFALLFIALLLSVGVKLTNRCQSTRERQQTTSKMPPPPECAPGTAQESALPYTRDVIHTTADSATHFSASDHCQLRAAIQQQHHNIMEIMQLLDEKGYGHA